MQNKRIWLLIIAAICIITAAFIWKQHRANISARLQAEKHAPNINCALGCNDAEIFQPKPTTTARPVPKVEAPKVEPQAQTNTCMEAIITCMSKNTALTTCAQQSNCSTECKQAIKTEVAPIMGNRLDKLNQLFLIPGGACHNTP